VTHPDTVPDLFHRDAVRGHAGQLGLMTALTVLNRAGMLIDPRGQVVCINAAANRTMGDGLMISQGRLRAVVRQADTVLQKMITQASAGRPAQVIEPVAIARQDARPIIVQATVLHGPSAAPFGNAQALVTLNGFEHPSELALKTLARAFGLTNAESRLASRLAVGEGLAEAASAFGVSLSTVRTHLKNIFAKTETHSQAEVAALLSRAGAGLQSDFAARALEPL
jgi:DNA-binding CsgD family transcriptional regulator